MSRCELTLKVLMFAGGVLLCSGATRAEIGACCAPDGSCAEVEEGDCAGEFLDAGTTCNPNCCPQPIEWGGECCGDVFQCQDTIDPHGGGGKTGVTVTFPIRGGGPATMARLGVGPDGLRLFFAGGEAVDPGPILRGNPAAIRFPIGEVFIFFTAHYNWDIIIIE